jgi:hypothetical protein
MGVGSLWIVVIIYSAVTFLFQVALAKTPRWGLAIAMSLSSAVPALAATVFMFTK